MSFTFVKKPAATTKTSKNVRPSPAIHHSAKKPKHLEASKSTELYVNNVSVRFPTGVNDSNIRDKMATLFARLQRVDPGLVLLPLKKEKTDLPVIVQSSSFPDEFHLLRNYITIPAFTSKTAKVHCYLQSTKRFADIKHNTFILPHLKEKGIWLDSHDIESFDVNQIGWFHDVHTEHYPRHHLIDKVKQILPETLHQHMQINVRSVQYYKPNQQQKVYTRAFVLEMDRAASADHIPDIFQRFNKADDLELIPMNSYYDTDDIFRNAFLTQNQSLNSYTSIRVDNLFGIDAVLTETGTGDKTTIRDLFKAAEDGENPFIHLIQYNSKRVNFLVKKDEEKWACDIINDFIYDYIAHHLTTESKALITTPDKAPRIIGSNQIPTQIAVYLQTAKKKTTTNENNSITSDFTSPPRSIRQTYATAAANAINRPRSPTSQLTRNTTIDAASQQTDISVLNNKIENMIQRAAEKNKEIAASQSVIDSQLTGMTTNVDSLATQFDALQDQLQQQQQAITAQNKALQNTTLELTKQNNTIVHQQQQQQVQIQYIQQMLQAIASQYPDIQLPTNNTNIMQQVSLTHTSLQQAAGTNNMKMTSTINNNVASEHNKNKKNNGNVPQQNNKDPSDINDISME